MFKQVGKAGAAHRLILGADVVPEVDGDPWQAMVFMKDDRQAVGQGIALEGNLVAGGLPAGQGKGQCKQGAGKEVLCLRREGMGPI